MTAEEKVKISDLVLSNYLYLCKIRNISLPSTDAFSQAVQNALMNINIGDEINKKECKILKFRKKMYYER